MMVWFFYDVQKLSAPHNHPGLSANWPPDRFTLCGVATVAAVASFQPGAEPLGQRLVGVKSP